jgi:hypothetical protein
MYLIGAELTGKTDFVSMAFIQRVRKDLRKYYHVLEIKRSRFNSDVNDLLAEIISRYNDAKYTIRKPRFSQIGRPKKIINERPLIFVGCDENSLEYIQYLKQLKIPANVVIFTDEDDWHVEIPGKCLKSDFYIPKKTLIKNMRTVIEQDRLIMNEEGTLGELFEAFKEYMEVRDANVNTQDIRPLDDLVLALAMPVWYYEHLLSIRPRTP